MLYNLLAYGFIQNSNGTFSKTCGTTTKGECITLGTFNQFVRVSIVSWDCYNTERKTYTCKLSELETKLPDWALN